MEKPKIIRETEDYLIVWKPAGMASETAKVTEMDLVTWLRNERKRKGEKPEIHLIERLDQPVEGLLLAAKTGKAAALLSECQRKGLLQKTYLALVADPDERTKDPLPERGTFVDFIKRNPKNRMAEITKEKDPTAKKAILHYSIRESSERSYLVEIRLVTGRFHQIRLQFSSRGWPIVGDRRYGGRESDCLHLTSYRLTFSWKGEVVSEEILPAWLLEK